MGRQPCLGNPGVGGGGGWHCVCLTCEFKQAEEANGKEAGIMPVAHLALLRDLIQGLLKVITILLGSDLVW